MEFLFVHFLQCIACNWFSLSFEDRLRKEEEGQFFHFIQSSKGTLEFFLKMKLLALGIFLSILSSIECRGRSRKLQPTNVKEQMNVHDHSSTKDSNRRDGKFCNLIFYANKIQTLLFKKIFSVDIWHNKIQQRPMQR